MLFRDEFPVLGSSVTLDENNTSAAFGIVQNQNAKMIGAWAENFGPIDAAQAVNRYVFIAPYPVQVLGCAIRYSTAGGAGATVTLEKDPSGTAIGSGTVLLSAPVAETGAANANYFGTVTGGGTALSLNRGDALSLVFAGTQTGLVGLVVSVLVQKI